MQAHRKPLCFGGQVSLQPMSQKAELGVLWVEGDRLQLPLSVLAHQTSCRVFPWAGPLVPSPPTKGSSSGQCRGLDSTGLRACFCLLPDSGLCTPGLLYQHGEALILGWVGEGCTANHLKGPVSIWDR